MLRLLPLRHVVLAAALGSSALAGIEITRTPDALLFGPAGDARPWTYRLTPPPDSGLPVEAGGYFHPLTTPRGVVVTDFSPADHKHHRGVFLAWVEMHGAADADFWGWGAHAPIKGRRIVNRDLTLEPTNGSPADSAWLAGDTAGLRQKPRAFTTFTANNEWLADDIVVLTEKLVAVPVFTSEANVLDLTYHLTPKADTTLARWAFGGFCVRFPKQGAAVIQGPDGVVDLPNPSHEKPETDWPAAPWYAATWNTDDGSPVGIAVVNDPRNPPALWHNHRDIRMLNPAITAPGPVSLKAGQPLVLRYRVVTFDGPAPGALLTRLSASPRK